MFKINKRINTRLVLSLLLILTSFFISNLVFASPEDILGINQIDAEIVLNKTDPRTLVVRIINIALGFLSIIAVSLIIYAGFVWMTSGGNEEKISKAKGTLKSAVIGLIIILSAWGIVSFLFKELGGEGSGGPNLVSNVVHFQNGLGAVGACTVESVYPQPGQKKVARNAIIMITFKQEVASSTINSENVKICLEGDAIFNPNSSLSKCGENNDKAIEFTVATNDSKVFVLSPSNYLGNENEDSSYIIYFSNDVKDIGETKSIFNTCSPQYLLWSFTVSNELDLNSPKIIGIFPQADNEKDQISTTSVLSFAQGSIKVLERLNYYQPATTTEVLKGPATTSNARAVFASNYNGNYSVFNVTISGEGKVSLSSSGNNLMTKNIIDNKVDFDNYFKLDIEEGFVSGNSWKVTVQKLIPPDKIKVGAYEYTFVNGENNAFNIERTNDIISQASKIRLALNNNSSINIEPSSDSNVILKSKVGGTVGNNIALWSSNENKISIVSFSGGVDQVEQIKQNDKKDKPMNSGIQINFNEEINPLNVSGTSDEVKAYIRVINLSEPDESKQLVKGKFTISSDYKTIEFISSNKCGSNSCGGDIFCLPASSNIKVEIQAASLFTCSSDDDCKDKKPFTSCFTESCKDENLKSYPLAISPSNGLVDTANNSLDGNSNDYSEGPISFYSYNNKDITNGDSVSWSFWVNSKIDSTPPRILKLKPIVPTATSTNLFAPIEIIFDKLLSTDSLRTGQSIIENGGESSTHNRFNLVGENLVAYWMGSENLDVDPIDGDPNGTEYL